MPELLLGKIGEGRRYEGVDLLESNIASKGGRTGGTNPLTEGFAGRLSAGEDNGCHERKAC
jgi:hypothetical protein